MTAGNLRHLLNTAWLVGAGALSKLLFLPTSIIIYKSLTLEGNGTFALAYALGTTFVLLTELGLRGYALRQLARLRSADNQEAQALFNVVLWWRVLLTALVFPLSLVLIHFSGYESTVLLTTAGMLTFAILDSFAVLLKAILRAYEKMNLDALGSVLGRTIILVLLLLCAHAGWLSLVSICAIFIIGAGTECLMLVWLVRRNLPLRFISAPPRLASMSEILLRSLPFAVLVGVGILYLRTGVFALSKLDLLRPLVPGPVREFARMGAESSLDAVAWFNAASRIPEALSFLPLAIVNAFIPYLSRHSSDPDLIQRTFTPVLRYLGAMGIAIAAPMVAEPELVLSLLSKKEFLPAAPALQILAMTIPLTFTLYVMSNFLICMGEEKIVMRRYIWALGINCILNLFLVPVWGATGAALALALSESTAVVLDVSVLYRRKLRISADLIAAFGGIALVGALAAVASRPLPPGGRALAVAMAGGCGVLALVWIFDRPMVETLAAAARTRKQTPKQVPTG